FLTFVMKISLTNLIKLNMHRTFAFSLNSSFLRWKKYLEL
ncbi:MAG: hypothetical protein ACI9LI_000656, partial [Saprospiraceae bacterium]